MSDKDTYPGSGVVVVGLWEAIGDWQSSHAAAAQIMPVLEAHQMYITAQDRAEVQDPRQAERCIMYLGRADPPEKCLVLVLAAAAQPRSFDLQSQVICLLFQYLVLRDLRMTSKKK